MADIYTYAKINSATGQRTLLFRSSDGSVDCGSRFKYIVSETELSYDALVEAINNAIDKEAQATDNQFITDEKVIAPTDTVEMLDYDNLIAEFNVIVTAIMQNDPTQQFNITQTVEKYLGAGKKVSESTYNQAEFIKLINEDLKDQYKL